MSVPVSPVTSLLRRYGWLAGLPALGLVWAATTFHAAPGIAARIATDAGTIARSTDGGSGEPWLRVRVAGRDLYAQGEAPGSADRDAALTRLAAMSDARRVVSEIGLVEPVTPFVWSAERAETGRIVLSGHRPSEIGRGALQAAIAVQWPNATLADDARAARGAPQDFSAAAAYAVARLAGMRTGSRATITDTILTFSGEAVDVTAYDALRTAFATPPEGFQIGQNTIVPPAVEAFAFAIERLAGGGLVLSGNTVSEAARGEIGALAAAASEGASVDDRMRTARGLGRDIAPDALARTMFRMVDLVRTGRVAFDGARISIAGVALDGQAICEVEGLMRTALPPGVAAGTATLTAQPLSPYRVSVRREAERVIVAGHLPDAAMRERVLAAIRPRFFRERIQDKTRTGEGAPANLVAALEATLPALAALATGEIAIADRTVRLSGESLYREAATRMAETLPRAVPPDWTARVAVNTRDPGERRDAETCRTKFSALLAGSSVRFAPGSGILSADFYPTLDALAALAKACPTLRFAVGGHADPPGTKPAKPEAMGVVADAGGSGAEASRPAGKPGQPELTRPKPAEKGKDGKAKDAKADSRPDAKATDAKATDAKPKDPRPGATEKPEAPVPEAPTDLARQRALVVVEYLLQAGLGFDQVSALSGESPAERTAVAFEARN